MQVRLYQRQIDRFKDERCSGAAIIRYAVKRYNRGDFGKCGIVCDNSANAEKVPLVGYPVKHRFGLSDSLIRQILDWHWSIPDEKFLKQCRENVKRLDAEIGEMMKSVTSVPYTEERV